MNNYNVYKHIFPNKKVYIGITCQKPEYRWRNGKGYYKGQNKMYKAIEKYGWENVKHEILFENLTKEEAEQKEIELISFYNSNKKGGYNIENGGNCANSITEETREKMRLNHKGMLGKHRTEETKKKLSVIHKQLWQNKSQEEKQKEIERLSKINIGRPSWNKGLKMSDEARKNMSIAQKKKYKNGFVPYMKGKKHTIESRKKMSEKSKGRKLNEDTKRKMKENNSNSKKIIILETGEIFNSGKECAESLHCHRSNPNFVCNGRQKTCKGYHMMWLEDYKKLKGGVIMKEEKMYIERKDGIKYYRRPNIKNYDSNLNIRIEKEKIEKLKEIANKKGVKYNALIREIIEDYIDENKEV